MSTNLELDEAACSLVMRRYGLTSKRDAVNFALRQLATAPRTREELELEQEAAVLRGIADVRAGRVHNSAEVSDTLASLEPES